MPTYFFHMQDLLIELLHSRECQKVDSGAVLLFDTDIHKCEGWEAIYLLLFMRDREGLARGLYRARMFNHPDFVSGFRVRDMFWTFEEINFLECQEPDFRTTSLR